ncbi:Rho guanine nucleotide exchange factor, putative [Entamoeba histolytica HM-1:IMSS-B]|uniref:Rho guanine nucleotide exchange factor, putative n=6 Tax=Entamoeba histolytica TaxID=5759 RepID=C4M038_ENTH1|nr:Rho guanine nucleotide exchange factor, putative [Entamoeba histolytica HM-1:IMSS]EMD45981.1 rho guanine nucleotide exchange factor, putative [Entamoeba histolytica KU27]EMH73105.1 Rho guanine nucleotide exchange factor, putative [Entamoeba histolytica HM-1:IMSS-B]EMS12824.1 Rho guanine nucleotide exchange factor, putative [Entamoeba histolytica HM-3:IMSS]ENY60776.1 Rho guanine nucleotide exchange factor, putative [Entamoeba histolytica HM-1:IMSS-A]GAT94507.1 rho guanine nucleotide exchange|eukprot:XP_655361.1 Rho guanine nucleotide exchange factor, putative [Entamoeba histolytica HM-1:IMSS]
MSKRLYVVNEIVSTEESYARALQTVVDLYITPLKGMDLISEEDMKGLFCNLEELLDGANQLTKQLKDRLKEFALNDNICDVFLLNKPLFNRFGPYIQNYEKASLLFDKLSKKKKFEEFCETQKENPLSNNGNLMSFLIFPVQRIPRYILLMKEYIKNTEKDHPDAVIAEQVRRYLDSYAKAVNAIIANENNKQKMRDIIKMFTDLDPKTENDLKTLPRTLVREGILRKQCRKAVKERYFYLFNDATVIYGEQQGKKIQFHQLLELTSVKDIEDSDISQNGFQLKGLQKSVVVYAETFDEKKEWVMDLNKAFTGERKYEFEEELSDNEAAPTWIPDDNVLDCMNCHSKFTLLNRRHHCRKCGRVLCAECTKRRVVIPHISSKPVRVCENCATKFENKDFEGVDDNSEHVNANGVAPPSLPNIPPPQRKQLIKISAMYPTLQPPSREPPELPQYESY